MLPAHTIRSSSDAPEGHYYRADEQTSGVAATVLAKCDILVSPWALGGAL